jgi:serine O-acetyltransferase
MMFSKNYVWSLLRTQATALVSTEPILRPVVMNSILRHPSFREALGHRLARKLSDADIPMEGWLEIFRDAFKLNEHSTHDLEQLAMLDLLSIQERDPACKNISTAFLYFKGYKALQCYRTSHVMWKTGRQHVALHIQSKCSELFGVDIHPAAVIGGGLLLDHATGVVIGETARLGKNCSLLHGVTLGATGTSKEHIRHPTIGDDVIIGANATILGNITIGNNCKIGSGSMVLKPLPANVTAVGNPVRIIGGDVKAIQPSPHSFSNQSFINNNHTNSSIPVENGRLPEQTASLATAAFN